MPNSKIKYIFTLALFVVLEFSFAQSEINRIDLYSHIWTQGHECLVLDDGNIMLAGKASDTIAQQQSFHLSLHDEEGSILNTDFIYDNIDPHFVGFQKNMIQVSENEIFYCYQGFVGDCYYYNLDDYSIYNMNTFGWIEVDSTNSIPYVIKNINDTLIISGRFVDIKTDEQKYVITKIKDKEVISKTFIDYPNYNTSSHIGRSEIFCINSNNYYAYMYTDENGPYLYHMVNDTLQNIITLDPEYYLHSGYLTDENHIVLSTHKLTTVGNIRYLSMQISEIDLEGNKIWENDLEEYIQDNICFNNGAPYGTCRETFLDKIIPAVDGNGYIYIGSEHVIEDEENFSSAIIGKIDLEGNVVWQRKYRYYDTEPAYNSFRDIEPDQYGGYIVYGDITVFDFAVAPYFHRAWLMRVDVDGLMIDTTVNTTNPNLKGYQTFTISPNPSKNYIQLSKSLDHIIVRDINGREVMSLEAINDQLNISSLSTGVYIITGQSNDDEWYRAKFVKE